MIWVLWTMHVLLFLHMVFLAGKTAILASPARFLYLANYFYFFILWALLVERSQVGPQEIDAYMQTLALGVGYILGVYVFRQSRIAGALKPTEKARWRPLWRPSSGVVGVYALAAVISCGIEIRTYETANPIAAMSAAYLSVEAIGDRRGSYVMLFVYQATIWLLFIAAVKKAVEASPRIGRSLVIAIVALQMYLMTFSGSKSFILLPLLYWVFIENQTFEYSRRQQWIQLVMTMAITGLGLVFLNVVRSGSDLDSVDDFWEALAARIDYIKVFAGYAANVYKFESLWPPLYFFWNLVPSAVADLFGLAKPELSFDVLYTRHGLDDYSRLSSSAGVGYAAGIETLRPIMGSFIVPSGILMGLASGVLTEVMHSVLAREAKLKGAFLFGTLVPAMHIVGFFELGPTLLAKMVIYSIVGAICLIPLYLFFNERGRGNGNVPQRVER